MARPGGQGGKQKPTRPQHTILLPPRFCGTFLLLDKCGHVPPNWLNRVLNINDKYPNIFYRPPVPADLTRPGVVYTNPVLPALPPKVDIAVKITITSSKANIAIYHCQFWLRAVIDLRSPAYGAGSVHRPIPSQRSLPSYFCCQHISRILVQVISNILRMLMMLILRKCALF